MTKPMYCPMSFNRDAYYANGNKVNNPVECTPDCAWAVKDGKEYGCVIAADKTGWGGTINTRPLKDDVE